MLCGKNPQDLPHLIPCLSPQPLFCPRPSLVNQLFSLLLRGAVRNPRGWTADGSQSLFHLPPALHFLQAHYCTRIGSQLLVGSRTCLPHMHCTCTFVSTSSPAKHFKFNEQQSNNVPEGMAFFSIPFSLCWRSHTVVWELPILSSRCCYVTLYVFAYFVRVIISKCIGSVPALFSKALRKVRIFGKDKKKKKKLPCSLNYQGWFLFCCFCHN